MPAPQQSMPLSKSQLDAMLALGRIGPQDYAKLLNQRTNAPMMQPNNGMSGIEAIALANAIRIQQQQQKAQSMMAAANTQASSSSTAARPLGNPSVYHRPMTNIPRPITVNASLPTPVNPVPQMKNPSPQMAAVSLPIKGEFPTSESKTQEVTTKTEASVPAKLLSLEDQKKVRERVRPSMIFTC
jgi:hypothetical protein